MVSEHVFFCIHHTRFQILAECHPVLPWAFHPLDYVLQHKIGALCCYLYSWCQPNSSVVSLWTLQFASVSVFFDAVILQSQKYESVHWPFYYLIVWYFTMLMLMYVSMMIQWCPLASRFGTVIMYVMYFVISLDLGGLMLEVLLEMLNNWPENSSFDRAQLPHATR